MSLFSLLYLFFSLRRTSVLFRVSLANESSQSHARNEEISNNAAAERIERENALQGNVLLIEKSSSVINLLLI